MVNAFDLIRLHRFGDKDDNAAPDTPVVKLPSYKAMCDMALQDKAVVGTLNREQHEAAIKDFEGFTDTTPTDEPLDWAEKLQRNQNGAVKGKAKDIMLKQYLTDTGNNTKMHDSVTRN